MKNLKELRQKINKTQKDVANDLGLQLQTYQNYELSRREPDNKMLVLLADYFNTSVDYILGRNNDNILNINILPPEEKNIISYVHQLSKENLMKAEAYIFAKLEEQNKK